MSTTERVTTGQLRTGDTVRNSGMRLVIDRPITHRPGPYGEVFHTPARIDNWDELRAAATEDREQRIVNSVPAFIVGQADAEGGVHRWVIQGNDLALWDRVVD